MRLTRKPKVIVPLVAVGLLGALALAGALVRSGTESPGDGGGRPEVIGSAARPQSATVGEKDVDRAVSGGGAAGTLPAASAVTPHHLRRSGDISLLVAPGRLAATVTRVTGITAALGGYVVSSTVSGGAEPPAAHEPQPLEEPAAPGTDAVSVMPIGEPEPYAWVMLRVPEERFQLAVQRVAGLGHVQTVATTSEDVTSQYVDLEARLRHFRQVERRLLRFLAEARTMSEMLAVQDRLDGVQLTIEQITAERAALRETTTYATLSVSLREQPAGQTAGGNVFWATLRGSVALLGSGARAAGLFITALLPFALVFGGVAGAVWCVVRRMRRRTVTPAGACATTGEEALPGSEPPPR